MCIRAMESIGFIQWCLDNLNYWTITLLMAIESSFIPFPSEVVVPPAAYKAASTGDLNIWLVILCATVGALIGALVNYFLALWLGKPIVYKFANSRFGHMCLIDQQKVEKAEQFFLKYGVSATLPGLDRHQVQPRNRLRHHGSRSTGSRLYYI